MGEYREKITFIDLNGRKVTWETEPNPLNSNQMWWWDTIPAMFAGTAREARAVAHHIKKNMQILEG